MNRDTETPGGTKGFSLNANAISRYYLTSEYRSLFLQNLREMVNIASIKVHHSDLQNSRIKTDEAAVTAMCDIIKSSWKNPLGKEKLELMSISTGAGAPPDVTKDIMKAKEIGEAKLQQFMCQ